MPVNETCDGSNGLHTQMQLRVKSYNRGAYYSAERNGTEHLIPQNTYLAEHIEMGPKQLPSLVVIIWRCILSK